MRLIDGPFTRVMAVNSGAITQTGANVSHVTLHRQPADSYNCNASFDS
jgi:hypothetical protein